MSSILIIKLVAIGITIFYILRNKEAASNQVGWLLVAAFTCSFIGVALITKIGVILQVIALILALVYTSSNQIKTQYKMLMVIFLIAGLLNASASFVRIPVYEVYLIAAAVAVLIYIYWQLNQKSPNALVISSIPFISQLLMLIGWLN